ncbi:MAG: hypothetical protein P8184_08305 [Calditrichia bacterium]
MEEKSRYPQVMVSAEMLSEASRLCGRVSVDRTRASEIDTLTGILGEYVFAQFFFGDWRRNLVGRNRGETDFRGIEVKTSAFPFNQKLNLLVREDYAMKRKPAFYVQVVLDVNSRAADAIMPGTAAYLCGFASSAEVDRAPKKDFGSKYGGQGGYLCHHIPIVQLHPISGLRAAWQAWRAACGNR